jgi:hypothetical protein
MKTFIVCEGFNTPPFRAAKKVLDPETNTSPKQHTSPFRARYVDWPYAMLHFSSTRSLARVRFLGVALKPYEHSSSFFKKFT